MSIACSTGSTTMTTSTMPIPPPALDYKKLFADPDMFSSVETFRAAGFTVKKRSKDTKAMIGSHPSVAGHLFKKFNDSVSCCDQGANYRTRVSGAEAIRNLIEKHRLDRLTVPRKWIVELPPQFAARKRCTEILVVERLDLIGVPDSKKRYKAIDPVTLEQLCRVLYAFSGFDAAVHNLMFTTAGQIAFFDTESWNKSPRPMKRTCRYLSEEFTKDSRKIVKQLFDRFDDEEKHG